MKQLQTCLTRYAAAIPALAMLETPAESATPDTWIEYYEQVYPLLEQALWSRPDDFDTLLADYQALFREQETLIRQQLESTGQADSRHRFILSIPVADRPAHLRTCLESIYRLCELYGYGGRTDGVFSHVQVIIAEDSREPDNIRQHRELAGHYSHKGLPVLHFDQQEQYDLLHAIPAPLRSDLGTLLTTQPREQFYWKGQAANRNLSILKCRQLTTDPAHTLYYFVDSDESFCVNRISGDGETAVPAINYFHAIDRIFRHGNTQVLTGKMVGDPPVSPSVMAANFLDDLSAFFRQLGAQPSTARCAFHQLSAEQAAALGSGAIYHDMAQLFGFTPADTFPYRCPLQGPHDHVACLRTLVDRLPAFFFGEHLTRKTLFAYGNGFRETTPARTIYPGNTIVNHAGLKYAIPFGHLRLRMSGPTAGRLFAAELGEQFTSANLPHLHQRTNEAGLTQAFRPGVTLTQGTAGIPGRAETDSIDLGDEFERQFFGDLLLFTTEALVSGTDMTVPFDERDVERLLDQKEEELLALYQQKHDAILEKNRQLHTLVFHGGYWWEKMPELDDTLQLVSVFTDNIQRNFGAKSAAWRQIQSPLHRNTRKQQLKKALLNYRTERTAWDQLFE